MTRTRELQVIPQIIPSATCLSCRVCCHFPDPTSALRPYFSAAEITTALRHGIRPDTFPDRRGSQISVVPDPSGAGYLCPAYDPQTSTCTIYAQRPLDCRLYPLMLAWNEGRDQVGLVWDANCPFPPSGELREQYAATVAAMLERDYLDTIAAAPGLIGEPQPGVRPVRPLPKITARLGAVRPRPAPLTVHDRSRIDRALSQIDTPLAAFSFASLMLWNELLLHAWMEVEGCLCVFAQSPDGLFMPLPPLGPPARLSDAAQAVLAYMREHNGGSAVSRIENIPAAAVPIFEQAGFRMTEKDPDYLYDAAQLAALAGDRHKAQRHAINQLERDHQKLVYEPYAASDQQSCRALHRRWTAQQEARGLDGVALHMLADSASAHDVALREHDGIGLIGRVLRVDGSLAAYTFGYTRSASTFCVALEVADRSIPGASAYIFRECCREASKQGFKWINTMDDSGLPALAHAKRLYHPVELVRSYIASAR